jgi:proteic killer suppression protein
MAYRKPDPLDIAEGFADLRVPHGNRLEARKRGSRRAAQDPVNDGNRICFVWTEMGSSEVEIVDYHKAIGTREWLEFLQIECR